MTLCRNKKYLYQGDSFSIKTLPILFTVALNDEDVMFGVNQQNWEAAFPRAPTPLDDEFDEYVAGIGANNWPVDVYEGPRPLHHSVYPWQNYRYIRWGEEGYDRNVVQKFIASCANYHKLPDLIWCKIYYSPLDDADMNFLSAFAYQNKELFHVDELIEVIDYVNRDVDYARLYTLKFMVRQLERSYTLRRKCYAYSIRYQHVLNCNLMPRGAHGSEFGPPRESAVVGDRIATDRCLAFYLNYEQMFDVDTDAQLAALQIPEEN